MLPDITKLSENQLIELNQRIIERLQLLRAAKNLAQLAQFSVGMIVEFDTDEGRTINGTIARLNQRTATVVGESGRWRVSPGLLRHAAKPQKQTHPPRIVALPRRREKRRLDRDDVGMIERGRGTRFTFESIHAGGIGDSVRPENLDRDGAAQAVVARAIDLAHAAGAKRADDFVRAESGTDSQPH
jgi:hypothetical protein